MAQKDPLIEYRNEGHVMFQELNRAIREEVIALLFHLQVEPDPAGAGQQELPQNGPSNGNGDGALSYQHETLAGSEAIAAAGSRPPARPSAAGARSRRRRWSSPSRRASGATTRAGVARARSSSAATALEHAVLASS